MQHAMYCAIIMLLLLDFILIVPRTFGWTRINRHVQLSSAKFSTEHKWTIQQVN